LMDNDDNLNAINGTCHLSALLEVWYDWRLVWLNIGMTEGWCGWTLVWLKDGVTVGSVTDYCQCVNWPAHAGMQPSVFCFCSVLIGKVLLWCSVERRNSLRARARSWDPQTESVESPAVQFEGE
jgi:hypothetical protein